MTKNYSKGQNGKQRKMRIMNNNAIKGRRKWRNRQHKKLGN